MSGSRDASYVLRLGIAALVIPVFVVGGAALAYSGRATLGLGVLGIGGVMTYLGYLNASYLLRDDQVRDERLSEVNREAAASGFWTVFNAGIAWFMVQGLSADDLVAVTVPGSVPLGLLVPALVTGPGLLAYLSFRAYYLRYGTHTKPWRWE